MNWNDSEQLALGWYMESRHSHSLKDTTHNTHAIIHYLLSTFIASYLLFHVVKDCLSSSSANSKVEESSPRERTEKEQ